VNKLWQHELTRILGRKGYQRLALQPYYVSFGRGLTFIWFAFTLLWFWGDWAGLKRVFVALSGLQWLGAGMVAWLASTVVLESWERLRRALVAIRTPDEQSVLASRYVRMVFASALGLVAFVMTALLNEPAPAIVYKAF
jgi:hypothetical protein